MPTDRDDATWNGFKKDQRAPTFQQRAAEPFVPLIPMFFCGGIFQACAMG
jgi:hypothetical protein